MQDAVAGWWQNGLSKNVLCLFWKASMSIFNYLNVLNIQKYLKVPR